MFKNKNKKIVHLTLDCCDHEVDTRHLVITDKTEDELEDLIQRYELYDLSLPEIVEELEKHGALTELDYDTYIVYVYEPEV